MLGPRGSVRAEVVLDAVRGQDAVRLGPHAAVVADGAGPLDPAHDDAVARFARDAATALALALEAGTAPGDALDACAARLRAHHPAGEDLVAAVGAAWVGGDGRLRALSLADVAVVVGLMGGEVAVVRDPRVDAVDAGVVARREVLRARGTPPAELDAATGCWVAEARRGVNVDGGYGALSRTAGRPVTGSWPLERVEAVLVCSDGLWRAVAPFGLVADAASLLQWARADGLGAVVRAVRAAEADDPATARVGRVDPADDATGVLLRRPRQRRTERWSTRLSR